MTATRRGGLLAGGRVALRLSGEVLGRVFQLALVVALGRTFEPATFGTLMIGSAVGLVLAPATDLGLGLTVGADVARGASARSVRLASALTVKGSLLVVAWTVLAAVALASGDPATVAACLVAAALSLDSVIQFTGQAFRGAHDFRTDWLISLLPRATTAVAVALVAVGSASLVATTWAWLAASVVGAALALWLLRRRLGVSVPDWAVARDLLRRAWPIGLATIVAMIYGRVPIFVLQAVGRAEDVGVYAGAARLFEPAYLIPAALAAVFFPAYARTLGRAEAEALRPAEAPLVGLGEAPAVGLGEPSPVGHADAQAGSLLRRWVSAAFVAGCVVGAGLFVLGPLAVTVIFGPAYAAAGTFLQTVAPVPVFAFPSYVLNHALVASGRSRFALGMTLVLLAAAVALHPLAYGALGLVGTAAVIITMEVVLFISFALRMLR